MVRQMRTEGAPSSTELPKTSLILIDDSFTHITGDLSDKDRAYLTRRASKLGALAKAPEHVNGVITHIARQGRENVEPDSLKAQMVTFIW